jgi:hypothetical protein
MFSHGITGGGGAMYPCECCILLHCLCNRSFLQSFSLPIPPPPPPPMLPSHPHACECYASNIQTAVRSDHGGTSSHRC